MQLKLVGIYLSSSQLEYILAINNALLQEYFNFKFEYYDSESSFCDLYSIKSYPTFLLFKNDRLATVFEGKISFSELKEKLEQISYITNVPPTEEPLPE